MSQLLSNSSSGRHCISFLQIISLKINYKKIIKSINQLEVTRESSLSVFGGEIFNIFE